MAIPVLQDRQVADDRGHGAHVLEARGDNNGGTGNNLRDVPKRLSPFAPRKDVLSRSERRHCGFAAFEQLATILLYSEMAAT